jgi:hypothetical protein
LADDPQQNRRQRRAIQFGDPYTPPEIQPSPEVRERFFTLDRTLGCILGFLGLWAVVSPPDSPVTMGCLLMAMIAVGIIPVLHATKWLLNQKFVTGHFEESYGLPINAVALLVMCGVIGMIGQAKWPKTHRHRLNGEEIAAFRRALGKPSSTAKESIQITCPSNDEKVCTYASQFISHLGESGWDVYGEVKRVSLKIPHEGIVLVEHAGNDSSNPKWTEQYAWTPVTEDMESVFKAFRAINICPDSSFGPEVPEGTLVVSFGEEAEDESAPNELLKTVEDIDRRKALYPTDGVPPWEPHTPGATYVRPKGKD